MHIKVLSYSEAIVLLRVVVGPHQAMPVKTKKSVLDRRVISVWPGRSQTRLSPEGAVCSCCSWPCGGAL